ncbi:helix-turn-helix domain-containing protein [Camelliibacillus cellulosilyticus]|uniref:Helix-turn-helix domain-containing protein n=1 Tax=Camelliibacillus cellulosilyticus TaxID=2174486 RepID=A0ABV9GP15_9BACL
MRDTLGGRIKHLRERKSLSQKKLAEQLQISNVQLSRYEADKRTPDPAMVAQIATFFDVTTDYLLGKTDAIHEERHGYLNKEDIELIDSIKKVDGLETFIRNVLKQPEDVKKLVKIWEIIKDM